jgi:hypothetical protein
VGDTTSLVPGYPIRTSSDPCSVDSSPRHIAASHVLHRLSMPRHPPCALTHLQTQKPTIKKIKNCTKQTHHPTRSGALASMLATTIQLPNTTPHHQDGATTPGVVSGPNSVPAALPPPHQPAGQGNLLLCTQPASTTDDRVPHGSHRHDDGVFRGAP